MTLLAKNGFADAAGCQLAADVLLTYGTLQLGVTGWSMFPTIWPGDTLTIERADIGDISKGDIVLFRRGRRLCAHRVVGEVNENAESSLLTRGDAMDTPDEPVSGDELLGKVTALARNGRSVDVGKNPRLLDRAISTLLQRSQIASRVVLGVHSFRASSRVQNLIEFE